METAVVILVVIAILVVLRFIGKRHEERQEMRQLDSGIKKWFQRLGLYWKVLFVWSVGIVGRGIARGAFYVDDLASLIFGPIVLTAIISLFTKKKKKDTKKD